MLAVRARLVGMDMVRGTRGREPSTSSSSCGSSRRKINYVLQATIYIEESLELNFYPKLISKCCACGKFCFYVISPNAWTPCDIHGGYVVVGETRFILRSRSVSTEHASHGISGAQAVNGTSPQRGDR